MLLNLSLTFLIFFIGCKPLNINNNYSSGNSNTPIVPPAGDEVKKGELLSTIATKQLENADLDKFASLTQEQLNEVLTKISAKDPAYKKDLMLKILAENKLNNFVKNNNLDDEFIKAMKTDDKDDYAFSNALLESALKDGNGIDETVKKDIVKKVFAFTTIQEKQITGFYEPRQTLTLGAYSLAVNYDVEFNAKRIKKDKQEEIIQKLTKIFALGDEAIEAFYDYIKPQYWQEKNITNKMDYHITYAIIDLIIDKKLISKIITNNHQILKMIQVINKAKDDSKRFAHFLSTRIVQQIKDLSLQQYFIQEANKYSF